MDKIKHLPRNKNDKIRILVLPVERNGCSWYRILQPYKKMYQDGLADVIFVKNGELDNEDFFRNVAAADVIVTRNNYFKFLNEFIYGNFDVSKKIIIADFDDDIYHISPYTDIYAYHGIKEVKHIDENGKEMWLWRDGENDFDINRNINRLENLIKTIKQIDLITVSTDRLKKEFEQYNKCVVVKNAIDRNVWKKYPIESGKEFRIGWTGGSTHYIDFISIKRPLVEFINKHNDVKFIVGGVWWNGITKEVSENKVEKYDWVDIDAHPFRTALMNLDLAVIPLEKNEFNKYKSCIKWYEFSALGVPSLVVNYPPYSDEIKDKKTGFLYNSELDFYEMLEELYNDRKKLNNISDNAMKWVYKNRDIKTEVKKLFDILNKKVKEVQK